MDGRSLNYWYGTRDRRRLDYEDDEDEDDMVRQARVYAGLSWNFTPHHRVTPLLFFCFVRVLGFLYLLEF